MLKIMFFTLLVIISPGILKAQQHIEMTFYHPYNDEKLNELSEDSLTAFILQLKKLNITQILIQSYSDKPGEPEYNMQLSAKRSEYLLQRLKAQLPGGIQYSSKYFGEETASEIVRKYGQADIICGANVMCHIPDLSSVARGVQLLLKKNGVFVFEEPYVGDMICKTSYDQIYDEHVYIFSLLSVINILILKI